jgi:RNA 2',3'-cyclic 3'-phosphodiesterase
MSMRLFIGIELPGSVRELAADAAGRLRHAVEAAAPRAAIRWVASGNLHVTIWFLGGLDDEGVEGVRTAFRSRLESPGFTMSLCGAGAFPPSGAPRALWLGLASGGDALRAIHRELAARLHPLGFEPERRPYAPHLTVARVKDLARSDTAALRRALQDLEVAPAAADIGHVTLFRSEPSAAGQRYTSVLRVPLS